MQEKDPCGALFVLSRGAQGSLEYTVIEDPRWQIKQNTRQLVGGNGQVKVSFSIPTSLDITAERRKEGKKEVEGQRR